MGGHLALADNPGGGSIFAFEVRLPECAAAKPLVAAPGDETSRPGGDARAHHRRFAVRGGGHGSAARGSGRRRRTRARPPFRPCGAERRAQARRRHCRLRAGPRGDQPAGPGRARGWREAQPRAVFAVRAAGLWADGAQGLRRLAGEAGPGALVVRAGDLGRSARRQPGVAASADRPSPAALSSPRTTTSTP